MARAKKPYVAPGSVTPAGREVKLEPPKAFSLCVEIAGEEMIQNNFSQKSIEQMLKTHMGIPQERKPKVPRECVEDAKIFNTKGVNCIPVTAIKKAMLSTVEQTKGMKKSQMRPLFWIVGKSIPFTFEACLPRMDMVRVGQRKPDVRFRPMFVGWKARFVVQYSPIISAQTVMDMIHRAGAVGLGEWRPEKDGTYGTFTITRNIVDEKTAAEVIEACAPPLVPLIIPDWAMDIEMTDKILKKIASRPGDEIEDEEEEEEDAVATPQQRKKA